MTTIDFTSHAETYSTFQLFTVARLGNECTEKIEGLSASRHYSALFENAVLVTIAETDVVLWEGNG